MSEVFKLFLLFVLLQALPFAAYANETPSGIPPDEIEMGSRIESISITGLGRTRLSTAQRPLQRFIGMEAYTVDKNDVIAAILAAGILQPVSVEIEGQVLVVEVQEMWAIFPIPMISSDSGGTAFGLFFVDANAFGLNDQLILGGHYHPNHWSATAGYIRSSRGGRRPGLVGLVNFRREERHDLNQNSAALRRFEFDGLSLRSMINFPLREDSDFLTASALFAFDDFRLRNRHEALRGPDSNLRLYGLGGEFVVKRRNSWDGFFRRFFCVCQCWGYMGKISYPWVQV